MILDVLRLAVIAVAMAAFCTFAVAQAFGLARRGAYPRALLALALPPVGAWLAYRAGMRIRSVGCLVSLCVYGVARALG